MSLCILPLGKLSMVKVMQHWGDSTLEVPFPLAKKVQLDLRKEILKYGNLEEKTHSSEDLWGKQSFQSIKSLPRQLANSIFLLY